MEEEIVKIKDKIQQQLCSNSFNQYVITVSDVIKGIGHLKHGKLMALRDYILIISLMVAILFMCISL